MYVKELEDCLEFMISIGFNQDWGAKLLADYFQARYMGRTADEAAENIFLEVDSGINREISLREKIAAFHKKLCRLEGFAPEQVSAAVEEFYKLDE